MTYRELLLRAIALARPFCIECGSDVVTVEYRDGDGWVPNSWHYATSPEDMCPVLGGGLAAWQCHEDLWTALEPHLLAADYGERSSVAVRAGKAAL